ncbi:MAG: HD domain-containing protein [Hydrococcus sp. SU_1_0]|nr:HD domain-containing protein [Hydrococcus sp. SU_1_0]
MNQNIPPTTELTSNFEKALVYATQLHSQQIRKGSGVPYISHLLSVAALVLEDGGGEDEAIAALLHDAIEDQGGDKIRQEIKAKFGEQVVNIVNGCTDAEVIPKPPWQERKQQYIEGMRHASPQVRRVSMADKLHNARSILADYYRQGNQVWSRFKAGKEGMLWYFDSLLKVDQEAGGSFLGEELMRVVKDLKETS